MSRSGGGRIGARRGDAMPARGDDEERGSAPARTPRAVGIRRYVGLPERAPWVVRCAPGLARVATTELRFRKILARGVEPTVLRQRNHDLLFISRAGDTPPDLTLRIPEELHYCPLFGRYKISQEQIGRLATLLRAQERPFRVVVTADGTQFPRLETRRWLAHRLTGLGVAITEDPAEDNVLWLFCIEEAYYVCLLRSAAPDAPERARRVVERPGSLPPTIAAAIAFLGTPRADDVIFDPVCGSGTLLAEAHGYAPGARLRGLDRDFAAVEAARQNLAAVKDARLAIGDGADSNLPAGSITLFLGNLPFGKQFGDRETNGPLYERLLGEVERLAAPTGARAAFLTADTASFDAALAAHPGLVLDRRHTVKIRGEVATVYVLHR